jgi:cytoskeletal protein CcmA (bactofilin family)
MMPLRKIKAGAIQYVLVVSVIIMIVLFAFISLIFLQNRLQAKSELYKIAIQNTYAGFDYLSQKSIPYNSPINVVFSEFDYEETSIEKRRWGLFDLGIVTSQLKNEISTKVALLGNHTENRKALYLQENNQPLLVVGNTKIVGDVTLPRRGVKTGNIAGNSYYGRELVYGQIERNAGDLPSIQNLEYAQRLVDGFPFENVKTLRLQRGLKIDQPFTEETLVFETPLTLNLENMSLSGNIILKSSSEIRIAATTQLDGVIIIAPKISVASNFQGNFQGFASKKIDLAKNVRLMYPSSLVVIDKVAETTNKDEKIKVNAQSEVQGIVLYYDRLKQRNYNTHIFIDEKALVKGEIYCNRNLELNGKIEGFVYTNNFITRQSGRTYINHLYNTEINAELMSEKYSGLFVGTLKPTVAKWMD